MTIGKLERARRSQLILNVRYQVSEPPIVQKSNFWGLWSLKTYGIWNSTTRKATDPAASGSLHEEIKLSQEHVPHDGLSKGEAGMDNSGDDMDLSVEVEELQMKVSQSGTNPFTHNLHLYNEMSKLARFDSEAAELMTEILQQGLAEMQGSVATRAVATDCSIGPAIGNERLGRRLKPNYSPSKGNRMRKRKKKRKDSPLGSE
jgi:hypothetical protein